jgi:hypothetical protein
MWRFLVLSPLSRLSSLFFFFCFYFSVHLSVFLLLLLLFVPSVLSMPRQYSSLLLCLCTLVLLLSLLSLLSVLYSICVVIMLFVHSVVRFLSLPLPSTLFHSLLSFVPSPLLPSLLAWGDASLPLLQRHFFAFFCVVCTCVCVGWGGGEGEGLRVCACAAVSYFCAFFIGRCECTCGR